MSDFYYQIKGKQPSPYNGEVDNWGWPPIFSGKVTATNKKQAKALIDDEYGRAFPQRVLKKDMGKHEYLINIREIQADDEMTIGLFELKECLHCSAGFRTIDLYNDVHEPYKGKEFCSSKCQVLYRAEGRSERFSSGMCGIETPVIYKVFNRETGMSYVGKTTQIFTLRWYQHFYQGGKNKFHNAIKTSKKEDWEFSIIETVVTPKGEDQDYFVSVREQFWIDELDSIQNGYNTVTANKEQAA